MNCPYCTRPMELKKWKKENLPEWEKPFLKKYMRYEYWYCPHCGYAKEKK